MLKLLLKPDEQGYQVREPISAHRVELYGGASRYRTESLDVDSLVDCQFSLNPSSFQYLRAFYNYADQGADDFLIDLVIDEHTPREYQARFRPGTWKLSDVQGYRFRVRLSLDVVANTSGLDFAAIVDGFSGDLPEPAYTTDIRRFKLLPDQTSYSLEDPDGQIATSLKAPSERMRSNFANTEMTAKVQFTLTGEEYDYARAFYQLHGGGAKPFVVDLLGQDKNLRSHIARIVPGSWRLSRVAQQMFSARWDLYVLPYDLHSDTVATHTEYVPQPNLDPVYPGNFGGEEFL